MSNYAYDDFPRPSYALQNGGSTFNFSNRVLLVGKFYRTAIRPAMLYGAECWPTKRRHVQQLSVAEFANVAVVLRAHKEG